MENGTTKVCSRCGETKSLDAFHRHPRSPGGRHPRCKPCRSVYTRQRYAENRARLLAADRAYKKRNRERLNAEAREYQAKYRDRIRVATKEARLRRKYGLSGNQWQALFASQGSACAACRATAPGGSGRWHTDHCHDTQKVRGILCHSCNVALGLLQESPSRILALHAYLARP